MARRCAGTAASTGAPCRNKVSSGAYCGRCNGQPATVAAPQLASVGAAQATADPFGAPTPPAAPSSFSIDPDTGVADAVEVAQAVDGLDAFESSDDTRLWLNAMRDAAPGSAEAHVAEHGVAYDTKAPLPEAFKGSRHRQRGQCYANAVRSIMGRGLGDDDYTYVEGYASDGPGNVPVRHAWLVDGEGRVVDPTPGWTKNGRGYVGITPGNGAVRQRYFSTPTWGGMLDSDH